MASSQSSEARELSLIDKVELRIALADSDTKLQSVLTTYLAPLLLKLSSEHLSVRNKVISICQHVNTRIKPQDIRLPVAALLKQFKECPHSPLVRHFDLLFVQQAIARLSKSELADLLPVLAAGIAGDASTSAMHGATMFHLFLRSLNVSRLPPKGTKDDTDLKTTLGTSDADTQFLSTWFGKLLLLRLGNAPTGISATCPGLSQDEYAFLTLHGKPEAWDPAKDSGLNLTEAKIKVLNLLASGLFNSDERLLPTIFASADQNSKISDLGEDLLKRTLPVVNLDDSALIVQLYDFYTGVVDSIPTNTIPPVRVPVRTKILTILSRASTSTTFPTKVIALVQRDLVHEDETAETFTKTDRESTRLRSTIISFLTFFARRAAQQDLDTVAPPVITSLKSFIEHQEEDDHSLEAKNLRGSTYEIIGQLAGAHKQVLLESNLSLLRWLMQSLSEERDKDVVVSIDESLSATLQCFQTGFDSNVETSLRDVLLHAMTRESRNARNVRYAAVRFANRCLAYNDAVARWIDILALGQTRVESHETVEEAKKGLDPYWYRLFHSVDGITVADTNRPRTGFPDFQELVQYIFQSTKLTGQNTNIQWLAVPYCRQALIWESLVAHKIPIDISAEWERKLDLAVSEDKDARQAIRKHLSNICDREQGQESIVSLWQAALQGMMSDQASTRVPCARVLVELCTLCPDAVIGRMSSTISALEDVLLVNDFELRLSAAQAYGLLSSHPDCDCSKLKGSLDGLLQKSETWDGAIGADVNKIHGTTLGLASFISHRLYRKPGDALAEKVRSRFLPTILAALGRSTEPLLYQASFVALGQLCSFYAVTLEQIAAHMSFSDVVEKVSKWAKAGNEKAITALGHIAMILEEEDEDNNLSTVIDHIHGLHEIRQTETQFSVGESLSCVASGWDSKVLTLDMSGPVPSGPSREKTISTMINRIINDAKTTKPSLKKASVIWLLCLIQFCGDRSEIQDRLRVCQAVFKRCLTDRDELVQEAASRGLGLVYEQGSRELKDDLVKDLIGSFSSNRADLAGTVTEDTELFAPGALPTGDGSIQTYKDIMSLAAETGDSSLVYRFMSLASNNAIWSSRAAFGRFGLSNVLSDSDIDGYLAANPKLYPKLFRYRFDPNSNVRRSMNDIWNSLVKDSNVTITKHFDSILEDLLTNIVNGEWRVRQASCAAIADLVQGRDMDVIGQYIDRIWSLCFKVIDDIKDSVRKAAAELSRVMIGILIRSLESNEASSANATNMLKRVLPFLLSTSGIESSAKEVQAISLHTLLEIIKKGKGAILRPFIAELVENLLGLLTALEPAAINYAHLNAAKYGVTEQELDSLRESSIRSGPLMAGVERCLDLLDEDSMKQLAPRLQSAMRTAVGLPSKIGCGRVLISLSTRQNFLFRPYADRFVSAIRKQMSDRNERVCSSYATALGYVARASSDESIIESAAYARRLYFDSEDLRSRVIAGEIVRAVGKYATDRFAALASEFLPLVYIARHDEEEQVAKVMREVWDDNTGGPRAATLYLAEVVALARANMASKRWILKHAAALAIAEATDAVAATQGQVGGREGELLWPALQTALAEKSWEGKERVLEGFVVFVKSGSAFWAARLEIREVIAKIATREARRRNTRYRQFALGTLAAVAAGLEDVALANETLAIAQAVLDELTTSPAAGEAMELDGGTAGPDAEEDRIRINSLAAAIDCIFQAGAVLLGTRQLPTEQLRLLSAAMQHQRQRQRQRQGRGRSVSVSPSLSLYPPSSTNLAVHRAIYAGTLLLLKKLLDAPDLAHDILDTPDAASAQEFMAACASLLLPIISTVGTGTGTGIGTGIGTITGRPYHDHDDDADDDAAAATPEALRLQRSDAILTLARVVRSHPRCRVDPLHDHVANLVSAERSLSQPVLKNLALALRLLEGDIDL